VVPTNSERTVGVPRLTAVGTSEFEDDARAIQGQIRVAVDKLSRGEINRVSVFHFSSVCRVASGYRHPVLDRDKQSGRGLFGYRPEWCFNEQEADCFDGRRLVIDLTDKLPRQCRNCQFCQLLYLSSRLIRKLIALRAAKIRLYLFD
jgi:hypothetical protein